MKNKMYTIIGLIIIAFGSWIIYYGQNKDSKQVQEKQSGDLEQTSKKIIDNSNKNTEKLLKSDEKTRQEYRQPIISVQDIFVDNQDNYENGYYRPSIKLTLRNEGAIKADSMRFRQLYLSHDQTEFYRIEDTDNYQYTLEAKTTKYYVFKPNLLKDSRDKFHLCLEITFRNPDNNEVIYNSYYLMFERKKNNDTMFVINDVNHKQFLMERCNQELSIAQQRLFDQ